MSKKALFCIIIILLFFAGIYFGKKMSNEKEIVNTVSNNVKENSIVIENTVEENKIDEQKEEENKVEEKDTASSKDDSIESAKEIVKNNWGEDDSVYYSYDGLDKDGRYIICVRDKSTTKALFWYYVDLETGSFEIE